MSTQKIFVKRKHANPHARIMHKGLNSPVQETMGESGDSGEKACPSFSHTTILFIWAGVPFFHTASAASGFNFFVSPSACLPIYFGFPFYLQLSIRVFVLVLIFLTCLCIQYICMCNFLYVCLLWPRMSLCLCLSVSFHS